MCRIPRLGAADHAAQRAELDELFPQVNDGRGSDDVAALMQLCSHACTSAGGCCAIAGGEADRARAIVAEHIETFERAIRSVLYRRVADPGQ